MRPLLPADLDMVVIEYLGDGEDYGGRLVKRAQGKLSEASVYVILTRMVARGYLSARHETDEEKQARLSKRGPHRRLYKVTSYGRQMYRARLAADQAVARALKGGQPKPQGVL